MVTPGGFLDIEVADATGIFSYDSDFFGVGAMRPGKNIRVMFQHENSTFYMFTGVIASITPHPKDHTATIYAVDAFERLNNTVVSAPISTAASTGGLDPSAGSMALRKIGGSNENIAAVASDEGSILSVLLTAAGGFTAALRSFDSSGGVVLTSWGVRNQNALDAIHDLERHERTGRIFINGAGQCVFHSSTHKDGLASSYTANTTDFQDLSYNVSLSSVVNAASVDISHYRGTTPTQTVIGSYPISQIPQLTTSPSGNSATVFIPFDSPYPTLPYTPLGSRNTVLTTGDWSANTARNLSGTDHSSDVAISGVVVAGQGIRVTLTNNSTDPVYITHTSGNTDTLNTLHVWAYGTTLTTITSTANNAASVTLYNERRADAAYQFLGNSSDGLAIATEMVTDSRANPRPTSARLFIAASDTETRRQILTRELGDKITVTAAELNITSKVYEIIGMEYSLTPDKGNDTVCYGYLQAIWSLDTAS